MWWCCYNLLSLVKLHTGEGTGETTTTITAEMTVLYIILEPLFGIPQLPHTMQIHDSEIRDRCRTSNWHVRDQLQLQPCAGRSLCFSRNLRQPQASKRILMGDYGEGNLYPISSLSPTDFVPNSKPVISAPALQLQVEQQSRTASSRSSSCMQSGGIRASGAFEPPGHP